MCQYLVRQFVNMDAIITLGREPPERIWLEDVSIADRKAMTLQRAKERDLCRHLRDRRPKSVSDL